MEPWIDRAAGKWRFSHLALVRGGLDPGPRRMWWRISDAGISAISALARRSIPG